MSITTISSGILNGKMMRPLFLAGVLLPKEKAAWYGDAAYSYTYSKTTKHALPWTPELLALKQLTERLTDAAYNSCLLNLYHNGEEGMAWHSDDEKTLAKGAAIASLSFGAERKFAFKHKQTGEKVSLLLEHGSLLVMKGENADQLAAPLTQIGGDKTAKDQFNLQNNYKPVITAKQVFSMIL